MCRNIKTLFNFEPPASEEEIHASALQFVRKLSGFNKPSQANEAAFNRAVADVSDAARKLLTSLHTHAPSRGPRYRGGQGAGTLKAAIQLADVCLRTVIYLTVRSGRRVQDGFLS
jgi:hypothetical protein